MSDPNVSLNEIGDIEYAGKEMNISGECLKENIKPIYVDLEKLVECIGRFNKGEMDCDTS